MLYRFIAFLSFRQIIWFIDSLSHLSICRHLWTTCHDLVWWKKIHLKALTNLVFLSLYRSGALILFNFNRFWQIPLYPFTALYKSRLILWVLQFSSWSFHTFQVTTAFRIFSDPFGRYLIFSSPQEFFLETPIQGHSLFSLCSLAWPLTLRS